MRSPLVSRKRLEQAEYERDLWQARAEALKAQLDIERNERIAERKGDPPRKNPRWAAALMAIWLILIGLVIGVVVPKAQGPTLAGTGDLPACIGKARYEHPIKGNQYQELVNALYTCHIYGEAT